MDKWWVGSIICTRRHTLLIGWKKNMNKTQGLQGGQEKVSRKYWGYFRMSTFSIAGYTGIKAEILGGYLHQLWSFIQAGR